MELGAMLLFRTPTLPELNVAITFTDRIPNPTREIVQIPMARSRVWSRFRSTKSSRFGPTKSGQASAPRPESGRSPTKTWSVYLIVSSRLRKTYVGVTTDLSRRLKQHNGELKGGAKASRAGRPWTYACIVQGFKDQSEACEFEAKWKSFSRKLPRRYKKEDDVWNSLLRHRDEALSRAKDSFGKSDLQVDWPLRCSSDHPEETTP